MRYVLTHGDPPVNAILLVESGSRFLVERVIPTLRQTWGEDIFIDLVTCYPDLPQGFRAETTRLYCAPDYRGPEQRGKLYRLLAGNQYAFAGIVCSGESILNWWKWAIALKLPAKIFLINENGDYFWFDRYHWRLAWRLLLLRTGLAGAGAVRTVVQLVSFPFVLLYLLLYATSVHARRALRRS